jgi:hypothetical protein
MSSEAEDKENFSWDDSECIVMKSSAGIAVYANPSNDVVIRQERMDDTFWERDPFIIIPRERVKDVIAALQREIEEKNNG